MILAGRIYVSSALLLASFPLGTPALCAAHPTASPAALAAAKAEIKAVLRPRTFLFGRDMVTFHYQNGELHQEGPFTPSNRSQLAERTLPQALLFKDASVFNQDMVGIGLYVSTDVFGSRSFGGDVDPLLFVITIRADARGLNATRFLSKEESARLNRARTLSGCDFVRWQEEPDLFHFLGGWRNSEAPACRRMIIEAVSELGIQAILYPYTSSNALQDCRMGRSEALNIVDPRAVKESDLAFYSNAQAEGPSRLRALVGELYREAAADLWLNLNDARGAAPAPRSLLGATAERNEYARWKAAHIHKCGRYWPGERNVAFPSIMQNYLSDVRRDRELAALVAQVAAAFARKRESAGGHAGSVFFDFNLIAAIEKAQAAAMGIPPAKLNAVTRLDRASSSISGPQLNAKIAAELGETAPPPDFVRDVAEGPYALALALAARDPARAIEAVRAQGRTGFRFAAYYVNQNLGFSGAPTLVIPFERARARPGENRAAFLAILRQCLEAYSSNQSFGEIQRGECAMRELPYESQIIELTPPPTPQD